MQDQEKSMPGDDDKMLRGYQARVPADLQEGLRRRLLAEMPARRNFLWPLAASAGIAAALAVGAWLVMTNQQSHPQEVQSSKTAIRIPETSAGDTRLGDITVQGPATSGTMAGLEMNTNAYSEITYADELGGASAIVLVRTDKLDGLTAICSVENVLYGDLGLKTLRVDMQSNDPTQRAADRDAARDRLVRSLGREPTDDEVVSMQQDRAGLAQGWEGILLLRPPRPGEHASVSDAEGHASFLWMRADYYSNHERLSVGLKRIAGELRDGNYLKPYAFFATPMIYEPKVAAAEAIVRASLTKMTDQGATWQITKTIKGQIDAKELAVNHALFDRRAEALVTLAALADGTPDPPASHAQRVRAERDALIKAELHEGLEAVLLLRDVRATASGASAALLARDFKAPAFDNLALTERLMAQAPSDPAATALALGRAREEDSSPGTNLGVARTYGFPSPEERVAGAPLIVRARIVGWKDTIVEYAVERVIYGQWAEKTITLDVTYGDASVKKSFLDAARTKLTEEKHRAPDEDELLTYMMNDHGIQKDHEVILLLEPRKGALLMHGEDFDVPPEHPLDKDEEQIVNVLHEGNYLEVIPHKGLGDIFQMRLNAADGIVRAKVVEITDKSVSWKVERILRGNDITETVQIDNTLYRQRAEAWVNYKALKDESLKDAGKHAAEVKKETDAMLKAELAPGREAILFLANLRHDANTTQADLRYRVYDTSKQINLDDLEAAILHPQSIEIHL